MERPIIVTGFEPFGGEKNNASWEAVRLLPDEVCGREVIKLKLPVVFGASGDMVAGAMREATPAVVVSVGEAGGRTCLTPERVAVNRMDARIPDNDGARPQGEPIVCGGPRRLPCDASRGRPRERIVRRGRAGEGLGHGGALRVQPGDVPRAARG